MSRNRFAALLTLIGSLMVVLGAFLPWVKVFGLGTVSIGGLEFSGGDAQILLGVGTVLAFITARVFLMKGRYTLADSVFALGVAGFSVWVALWNMAQVNVETTQEATVGVGLWVVFLGGVTIAAGAATRIADYLRHRKGERRSLGEVYSYYNSGKIPKNEPYSRRRH